MTDTHKYKANIWEYIKLSVDLNSEAWGQLQTSYQTNYRRLALPLIQYIIAARICIMQGFCKVTVNNKL